MNKILDPFYGGTESLRIIFNKTNYLIRLFFICFVFMADPDHIKVPKNLLKIQNIKITNKK